MRVLAPRPAAPSRRLSPRRPLVRARRGFALEATLIVLVLVGALAGLTALWVATVTRTSGLDYRSTRAQAAAEAGADAIMAQLEAAMVDGLLTDPELDALTLPALNGFTFESMDVNRAGAATMGPITKEPYKGLYALNQPIELRIAARDARANRAEVVLSVNAQSIPLFQFGVFYEGDLEIHPGRPMEFAGWVHTNGNLYLSSDYSYFQSRLTTPDSVFWRRKDTQERRDGVYINNDAGAQVRLNFDSRPPTTGDAHFRQQSESRFNSRLMSSAHGVTDLRLPLSAGVPPIAMIEPRDAGDGQPERNVKFAWKADWYIEFNLSTMGAMCNAGGAIATSVRPAGKAKPTGSTCGPASGIFKWTPNAFREGREDVGVDVLDIDVDKLRAWRNSNAAANATEIVYITFKGAASPANQGDFPVVRLRNATRLPNALTIATSHPLYLQGDFNTSSWQPAALLGDAITILSGAFSDGNHSCTAGGASCGGAGSYTKRNATNTSVFAAVAAGHSATPCDRFRSGCGGGNYGGGLENFPRFVENWTGVTMTYRGSLVSLFESQRTTKRWQWRSYYDAPDRDWEFDVRFQDPTKLPPGTPAVGNVYQTAFRPVF